MRIMRIVSTGGVAIMLLLITGAWMTAQTMGVPEEFTAVAVQNNTGGSGIGRVYIRITRWTTDAERDSLVKTLLTIGPNALLDALKKTRPVGTIRTPDSLAYDLHYASQTPLPDGGRKIVLGTDRPIGFWELVNQARTVRYPFTIIQMQMGKDGTGTGTLSVATKITAHDKIIELENFNSSPVMLTEIKADKSKQ